MNRILKIFFFLVFAIVIFAGCGNDPVREKQGSDPNGADKLAELQQLAIQQPQNASVFNELALYYLSKENFNDALRNINISLQLEPVNIRYLTSLSDIYLMMGEAERAQTTLYKALDLEPNNADVYTNIGRLQIFRQDYVRAFENLRKALEINRNHSDAYFWRGLAWLENGDTLKAISDWQLSVANDPDSFGGYFQLGLLMAGRNDRYAFDYLDHALKLAPEQPELLYDIGYAFQQIERFTKAVETYNRILSIDSCFFKALYNIGFINLTETEDYPSAIKYFDLTLKCRQDYVDALYNRGLAHELLNDFAQARADYQGTLNILVNYPKAIDALNRLDKLQR